MIGGIVRHASLFIGSLLIGALLLLAPAALRAPTVWELPPELGGMRSLSFGPGTRSARAITGWVLNGPWKFAMQS